MTTTEKTCYCCCVSKPISAFFKVGRNSDQTRVSCKDCQNKAKHLRKIDSPLFAQVMQALGKYPMTSMDLLEHVDEKDCRKIAGFCRSLFFLGFVDNVKSQSKRYGCVWFLSNNPPLFEENNRVDYETEQLCRGIPITPEDLAWMQRYRAQAERRRMGLAPPHC